MIWIIGGTSDANKIADLLLSYNKKCVLSVTTVYGGNIAKDRPVKIVMQKMALADMEKMCIEENINFIIDASHPFAQEVSENAIKLAKAKGIMYVRYERPSHICQQAKYYSSYTQISDELSNCKGNILLTIGSKNLSKFKNINPTRIIARVLPVTESLILCENVNIPAHNILAMRGISSVALNEAIMRDYEIKHLVTKDSGEAGGVIQKIEAAQNLGIDIHILSRPEIDYPIKISDINTIKKYL
jgi:precorrin-6A/cobalt-precorrin-6A reductase